MPIPPLLIKKVIIEAAKNPKAVKKILTTVLALVAGLVLLPAVLLSSLSPILKDGVLLDENFNITSTSVYQSVERITNEVLADMKQQMQQKANQIEEEHTETFTDEEGNTTEECTVSVSVVVNPIDLGYILAYLSLRDETIVTAEDYSPDKAIVEQFINDITEINIQNDGDNYIVQNSVKSFLEVLETCVPDSMDKEYFEVSYQNFSELIAAGDASTMPPIGGGGSGGGGVSLSSCHPKIILLANKLVSECTLQGYPIRITETVRTVERQDQLYAQGRTEPGNIVTNAKGSSYSSMHQWGIAFDICRADGKGAYNESGGYFNKVGQIGKNLGLEWGGDWSSIVDKPHFQLPDWGSSASNIKRQYGNPNSFAETWR